MSMFGAFDVAGSGLRATRKWLDAVSDNIANIDNVTRTSENAFQARYVVAQEAQDGNGAQVGGIAYGSAEGKLVYEPANPLADSEGYVRYPDIDMGDQMVALLMAQRGYQANLAVVERATTAYQAALQLGKG